MPLNVCEVATYNLQASDIITTFVHVSCKVKHIYYRSDIILCLNHLSWFLYSKYNQTEFCIELILGLQLFSFVSHES